MQSRQSVATNKLGHDAWPTAHSIEPIALTGTEGLSLSAFRASLTGYYNVQVQGLEEIVANMRAAALVGSPGVLPSSEGVIRMTFWALLKLNWARATLLGDIDAANRFLNEAREVASTFPEDYREWGVYWAWFDTKYKNPEAGFALWAGANYTVLMHYATLVESEAVILPDAFDPEGYVRQNLQHVSRQLTRAAETIVALTDGFPEGIR